MFKKKRLAIINQNKLQIQFCVARWVVIFSQWIFLYGASRVLCFAGIHFELLWLSGTSKRMRNTQRRIYSPTKLTFKHSWIQLRSSLDKHMITFSPLPFTFSPLSPLFLHFLFFPFPLSFSFPPKVDTHILLSFTYALFSRQLMGTIDHRSVGMLRSELVARRSE